MPFEQNYVPDPSGNVLPSSCGISFLTTGIGAPTCVSNEGRIYIDLATGDFYRYVSGAWVIQFTTGGGGGGAGLTYYQGSALDPNGTITGSIGDVYHSRLGLGGDGSTWWKVTGTATNTGWE
jgi:hypothetical protein